MGGGTFEPSTEPTVMTDSDRDNLADDPELSADEEPQAMHLFTEPTRPDVRLDPDTPAFDRVQDGKAAEEEIADENEREYNRRYVREHGDHHGHAPTDDA